jgi:Holliday junction resolvase
LGKIVTIYLSDDEARDLKEFCDESRCTQYSALKTAVRQLLYRPNQVEEKGAQEIAEEPEEIYEELPEEESTIVEEAPEEILEQPEEGLSTTVPISTLRRFLRNNKD